MNNASASEYLSLEGEPVFPLNPTADGMIRTFHAPGLRLFRTRAAAPRGTFLLCPGGGYGVLEMAREGANTARFLNSQGFDVAVLEYDIASGSDKGIGSQVRELALGDALEAWRLLKRRAAAMGLCAERFGLMGYSAGAHLSARTAQALGAGEQPDDVVLIYPAYLHESHPGEAAPAVLPPKAPGRLFALIAANDNPDWVRSCREYVKTWIGYDGAAVFHLLPDAGHGFGIETTVEASATQWPCLLQAYFEAAPEAVSAAAPNPAAVPAEGGNAARHAEKRAACAREKYDLILVGDSITHNLELPEFASVWNRFYAPRRALNLGYSGYRTENILWNLQDGELAGQSPKVITLMAGTNNVDKANYPTRHTAGQVAGGLRAIVGFLRQACPGAKILLLACFPGCYGGPNPTSHRAILERASELVRPLADEKEIFFLDVNAVFLTPEGAIDQALLPDFLHPNAEGALRWARAMEPLLSRLMGDVPRGLEAEGGRQA